MAFTYKYSQSEIENFEGTSNNKRTRKMNTISSFILVFTTFCLIGSAQGRNPFGGAARQPGKTGPAGAAADTATRHGAAVGTTGATGAAVGTVTRRGIVVGGTGATGAAAGTVNGAAGAATEATGAAVGSASRSVVGATGTRAAGAATGTANRLGTEAGTPSRKDAGASEVTHPRRP
jgi:hypothetical protein